MKGKNLDARIALPTLAEKLDAYHRALLDHQRAVELYHNDADATWDDVMNPANERLWKVRAAYETAYLESFQWR